MPLNAITFQILFHKSMTFSIEESGRTHTCPVTAREYVKLNKVTKELEMLDREVVFQNLPHIHAIGEEKTVMAQRRQPRQEAYDEEILSLKMKGLSAAQIFEELNKDCPVMEPRITKKSIEASMQHHREANPAFYTNTLQQCSMVLAAAVKHNKGTETASGVHSFGLYHDVLEAVDLKDIRHFFVDVTYKCTPKGTKMINLLGFDETAGTAVPLAFGIISHETELFYHYFLDKVKSTLQIVPEVLHLDFDKAQRNAAKSVFPSTRLHGCAFHLMKACKKHFKDVVTIHAPKKNLKFSSTARILIWDMVTAASREDFLESLRALRSFCVDNGIGPFFNYFHRQWVVAGTEPELWATYELTEEDRKHRTNNHLEVRTKNLQYHSNPINF